MDFREKKPVHKSDHFGNRSYFRSNFSESAALVIDDIKRLEAAI